EPPSPSVLGMKKESAFVGLDEADPGVRAFVFHCMQSDISKRPHSVAEALYELNHTNPSDRCLAPEVIEINPEEDSAPATPPTPSNELVPQPLFSLDENKDDSVPLVQGEPIDPAEEPEEAKSIVVPEEAKSIPVAPTAPTPRQPKPQQPTPNPEDAPDSDASHGGTFGLSENSDNSDNSDYYSDSEIVTNPNERPRPAPQPATPIASQEKRKSSRLLLLSVLAGMVLVIGGVLAFRSCGNEAAPAYSLDEAADSTTLDSTAVEPADTLANETPVAPAPSAAPEPLGAAPSNAERQTTTTPATSSNRSQSTRQNTAGTSSSSRTQANSGSNAYSSSNNNSSTTTSTTRPQSNTSNASTSSGRSSSRQTLDFRNSGTSTSSSQSNASSSSGNSNSNRRTMDFR
ncbi:MAG: hypothetical protein IKH52_02665, partial [Bacteroidaceae bacterium]|nr:hypothetical protein [Bacteroidaceae bacterium]